MDSRQQRVKGYRIWRSLDQPAAFFGIKGRFMTLFVLIAAAAAVIALTAGSSYGTMLGMVVFGALAFCDCLYFRRSIRRYPFRLCLRNPGR